MLCIGISGQYRQTADILKGIYNSAGKNLMLIKITDGKSIVAFPDIIILHKLNKGLSLPGFCKRSIVIANMDSRFLPLENSLKTACLVTVGSCTKSSFTLSSFSSNEHNLIQCCIQRSLPVLSGGCLCEQEFCIKTLSNDIPLVLSAVAAALISGISIDEINSVLV